MRATAEWDNSVKANRIPCVGAIIRDAAGRLLLIRRGHEPEAGSWSLPGGRVEPGESDAQALVREMREETGLIVQPGPLVGAVERPGPGGSVLDIRDYAATVIGGTLAAGDDAVDARWVAAADVARLALTTGLADALTAWGVLAADPPGHLSTRGGPQQRRRRGRGPHTRPRRRRAAGRCGVRRAKRGSSVT